MEDTSVPSVVGTGVTTDLIRTYVKMPEFKPTKNKIFHPKLKGKKFKCLGLLDIPYFTCSGWVLDKKRGEKTIRWYGGTPSSGVAFHQYIPEDQLTWVDKEI